MNNPGDTFDLSNLNLFSIFIEEEVIKLNPGYLKPVNTPYDIKTELTLGANEEHQFLKAQLLVEIRVMDKVNPRDLVDSNLFAIKTAFLFRVDNFPEVVEITSEPKLIVNNELLTIIGSVCYSTARGIILARLANTPFADCILPLIKPDFKTSETNLHK